MPTTNIGALVVDHFFDQDLINCVDISPRQFIGVIPYQRWAIPARLCFPPSAFNGLEAAYSSKLHLRWKIFQRLLDGKPVGCVGAIDECVDSSNGFDFLLSPTHSGIQKSWCANFRSAKRNDDLATHNGVALKRN